MTEIIFDNVSLRFPLLTAGSRSIRHFLAPSIRSKRLNTDPNHDFIALNQLTFRVREGERVGIVGRNGSGKTSLLRLVSGIYSPTSGGLSVIGDVRPIIDISIGFNPEATGRENVTLRGRLLGLSRDEIADLVRRVGETAEIGSFLDQPFRTYSSGMQMRLAFSVSTTIKPEILVMDEWLSVGDEAFRAQADLTLNNLVSDSKILIMASHSRSQLEKVCTRIIHLRDGSVVEDGPAAEVLDSYFGIGE